MGSFESGYREVLRQMAAEAKAQAIGYARYRVQEDFNTELIKKIAKETGHKNFAATCFVEVNLESDEGNLSVDLYTEESWIDGMYKSNSAFHPGTEGWNPVSEHYHMSKEEFWDRKLNGDYSGDYGGVESKWLIDNFWAGIVYYTNGWPRGAASYLLVGTRREKSAASVVDQYFNQYKSKGTYQKYLAEAISKMK